MLDTSKVSRGFQGVSLWSWGASGVRQPGTQLPHCACRRGLCWDLRHAANRLTAKFPTSSDDLWRQGNSYTVFEERSMTVYDILSYFSWEQKCTRYIPGTFASLNAWNSGLRRGWRAPGGLWHGALLAQPGGTMWIHIKHIKHGDETNQFMVIWDDLRI